MKERRKVRAHAFYAPSGAHAWLDCAPSVLLDLGDFEDATDYSTRGDLLHACADLALKTGSYSVAAARLATGVTDEVAVPFGEAEADSVRMYVDYVRSRPGFHMHEVHSWFIKGLCGGTSDTLIFDASTKTLEVVDFKAGFVQRFAKANPQLLLYGLGAVRKYASVYDIRRIRLTIVQSMHLNEGDEPDSWVLTRDQLERWGLRFKSRIEELERLKAAGDIGEFKASKSRCQFCNVSKATKCPEQEKAAKAAATEDFSEYERPLKRQLTDAEKWEIACVAEVWIKKLKERVTSEVLGGTNKDGFKVVLGNGSWGVEDKRGFVDHLTSEGFGETDIYEGEPKLLSLNKAKKLYSGKGSGQKREALEVFFTKSEGARTVVPSSDPRPATDAGAEADKEFADYKREGDKTS